MHVANQTGKTAACHEHKHAEAVQIVSRNRRATVAQLRGIEAWRSRNRRGTFADRRGLLKAGKSSTHIKSGYKHINFIENSLKLIRMNVWRLVFIKTE